jgi:hypothetical protein
MKLTAVIIAILLVVHLTSKPKVITQEQMNRVYILAAESQE